jgi:hypothetical protein
MMVYARRIPSPARRPGLACALAVWLGVTGCATPGARPAADERDDIVAIRQFYPAEPWLYDEDGRVTGTAPRVYLVGAADTAGQMQGVFVPGDIKAQLYALRALPDGGYARDLVHEWTFDRHRARDFRITKPSIMGNSYGLVLRWPPELRLAGREIQIAISYTRANGDVVSTRGSRFRVPLGLASPAPATRPAPAGAPR